MRHRPADEETIRALLRAELGRHREQANADTASKINPLAADLTTLTAKVDRIAKHLGIV